MPKISLPRPVSAAHACASCIAAAGSLVASGVCSAIFSLIHAGRRSDIARGLAHRAARSTVRRVERDPARDRFRDLLDHVGACASGSHQHVEPVVRRLHDVQRRARAELPHDRAQPAQRREVIAIALQKEDRPARRRKMLGGMHLSIDVQYLLRAWDPDIVYRSKSKVRLFSRS